MADIRPLEASDLPAVNLLMRAHLEGWDGDETFLAATALDHPWADPEFPSLVATEDGRVVGSIVAQVRRLRFDDREIRGVCCSHLVVDPTSRSSAAGALLLSRLLAGPQELTWSDSANDPVLRMWRVYGGQIDHSRACDWMLVLRPLRWLAGIAAALPRRSAASRELIPVAALPFQALGARRRASEGEQAEVSGEDAGAAAVVEHWPALAAKRRIRADYDQPFLDHLFSLVGEREGRLTVRLVRRGGTPIGLYACLPSRGRGIRVLHLSGREPDISAVMGELVEHARGNGARFLFGRMEPHLDAPVRQRLAAIGLARRPIVHSRDPELLAALQTDAALLTRLDSEWFWT